MPRNCNAFQLILTILLGQVNRNISGTVLAFQRVSFVDSNRHQKVQIARNFCSRGGLLCMRKGPRLAATGFAQKQAVILNQGTSDASDRNRSTFSCVVSDRISSRSARTLCRSGLGLVEEQQSISTRPQRDFRQRRTWVETAKSRAASA